MKNLDDIIKRLLENIIIPKYPSLEIHDIDSFQLVDKRIYDVRFIVKEKLPSEIQQEIDSEVKLLFKMAGLEKIEEDGYERNKIKVWFKTPREKEFTFSHLMGYNR